MAVFNNILAGAAGSGGAAAGYEIERSLRFNSADSAHLSKTFGSAGNRKTWTWSGWVKRASLSTGNDQFLFSGGTTNSNTGFMALYFDSNHKLSLGTATTNILITDAVYRDVSAWMHVVFAFDATAGTDAAKAKIYVNGSEITAFGTDNRSGVSNQDYGINQAALHEIARNCFNSARYFDGYLADVHFIDGQALDPTSFGEFDDNGVWQPIEYTGSYPGNSFHLDFADNSSAAALGYDAAGSNDWTVNNITATATSYVTRVSATGTGGVVNYANAWDGNLATFAYSGSSGSSEGAVSLSLDFSNNPITVSSTVRVYFNAGGGANVRKARINGGSYVNSNSSDYADFSLTGTLTSIDSTLGPAVGAGYSATIAAIDVDGTRLISSSEGNIDSLRDSPTNGDTADDTGAGGEVPGNYATLNPLDKANITTSNGNLDFTHAGTTGNWQMIRGTIGVTSGKWYWETTVTDTETILGIATGAASIANDKYVGNDAYGWGYSGINGQKLNSASGSSYGNSYTSGDVIGVAFDADAGSLYFYKNGTVQNSGTAAFTGLTSGPYFPAFSIRDTGHTSSINFGQRAFANTSAPSGFKALCTANFDTPTIEDPSTVMDVKLYTGNGSSQTISGLGFSPDLVWIKNRGYQDNHAVTDTVRGATKWLLPNDTNSELTYAQSLTAFTSDGFSVGSDDNFNRNTYAFVSWCWDAGTSNATNTSGSITSTVRANISAGFSIVTYSGVGYSNVDDNFTVGHGLGVKPAMVIVKKRTASGFWAVWHTTFGDPPASGTNNKYIILNSTGAQGSLGAGYLFKDASTSDVIGIGVGAEVNGSGSNFVAYCFAPVEGYSAFGSYTGNGSSTSPPFVYTGFRVKWLMLKCTSTGGSNWILHDVARKGYNAQGPRLFPNLSNAESTPAYDMVDLYSNGFSPIRTVLDYNQNGNTYIWAAFSENPFKYARAR